MKTLRTSSLALASVALAAGVSGCGLVLGLGDFTEGTGGAGGSGGATASSGSGSGTTTGTTTSTSGTGGSADPCANGKKDQNETDKDCGGVCAPCADGKGCGNASDCVSHVCSAGGSCSAPTCTDTTRNGTETDVDCGSTCPKCADGKTCAMAVDCVSGLCTGGMCFSASCGDGTKNGAETDVDCGGGSCPACAPNKVCAVATDCGSGICKASVCIDDHVWSERFGDADVQTATDVAVDGLGNVTLLGNFLGTINLGGATLTNPCVFDPQAGDYCDPADNYLARFDGAGKHIWSKRFVNKGDGVSGYGITSAGAGSGDTWILSYAMGSLDFGAGEIFADPTPCPPGCAVDTTIARLDSTGKYVYGKRYSGVSGSDDIKGAAIAVIPAGDVAITGAFSGGVSFGVGTLTSAGSYDVFVAKLNGDGTQHWAKRFGENTAVQEGRAVALDGAGNVFVAGTFKVSIDLGGGALSSAGGSDLFLAKLNSSNGGYLWAKRFGDVQDQISTGTVKVATDAAGNVFFAGPLQGSVNFGGGVLTATAGKIDMFVAKFDMGGTHLWSKRFGDAQAMASSTFGGLAVDTAGALIFTGTGNGSVDFGGGPLVGGFLVKLDPSGAHVWSKAYGGGAVATDGAKSIVLAGALFGTQDFGGGPLTSAGSSDAFVAKFIDP